MIQLGLVQTLATIAILLVASASVYAQSAETEVEFQAALDAYRQSLTGDSIEDQLSTAKRLLQIGEEVLPDQQLAWVVRSFGNALLQKGETEAARDSLARALEMLEEYYGPDSAKLIPVVFDYANAHAEWPPSRTQQALYRRALRMSALEFGRSSLEYASLKYGVGRSLFERSRDHVAARRHVKEAHKTFSQELGQTAARTGRAAFLLGKIEIGERKYGRAQDYFESALLGLSAGNVDTRQEHLYSRSMLVRAYELDGKSDLATEHCIAIGRLVQTPTNQEYKPIFSGFGPLYPEKMLAIGQEGHVDLVFTVDESGFVRSPTVVSHTGPDNFIDAALSRLSQFRYAPRIENGQPVPVENVKTRISFTIEDP